MELIWTQEAIEHMWANHRITPAQANEAVNDPNVVVLSPDPKSKSGLSDRYIGMIKSLNIIVVIAVRNDNLIYGANAWKASGKDVKIYQERNKL